MGKTMLGSSKHEKDINMLTKDQSRFLSSVLSPGTASKAKRNYQQFLESGIDYGIEDMLAADPEAFKKGVVDPMMQQYNQQVLPATQQRFVDANAGSSSALNQALASGANDLTVQMGQMYLPFLQNKEEMRADLYKQQNANRLTALSGLNSLAGQQTFTPLISKREGIAGPLINAAGNMAGAGIKASSETVKENIREYEKGLDVVKNLDVKIYDYVEELGGDKNKIGVIAEKVPQEIQGMVNGVLGVDLYGLIGLLINSVKELNKKIEVLEGKCLSQ